MKFAQIQNRVLRDKTGNKTQSNRKYISTPSQIMIFSKPSWKKVKCIEKKKRVWGGGDICNINDHSREARDANAQTMRWLWVVSLNFKEKMQRLICRT